MKRAICSVVVAAALACVCWAAPAGAFTAYAGVEHFHYAAGPYPIRPGANLILVDSNHIPKPAHDGYIVRMAPNLHYALANGKCCGKIPRVDVIHLHHGVWLSDGTAGAGEGNSYGHVYPFMASGEEKTITEFPHGYGYPVAASDSWVLNYMIHNLTAQAAKVYITYDIDFVPTSSPAASTITAVHPIWMDVQAHHLYPVFDVHRGSGVAGKFTYPDMAHDPYGSGPPLNQFTVDHAGSLISTAGHVHPGGLYDDLDLVRSGATPSSGTPPGPVANSVRLFRSVAHYFNHLAPISWDMAMTATSADWRPLVKAGDVLRVSTTYESKRASWYESMGIMVVWEASGDTTGVDPFTHRLDENGHVTHGHLAEDNNHGGMYYTGVSPKNLPTCLTHRVAISGFRYNPGGFTSTGSNRCVPTIRQGSSLRFVNDDASPLPPGSVPLAPSPAYIASIFHTITACQNPCGLNTGISYPLANGAGGYDSGQLGVGTPATGQLNWSTPASLPAGTYTFFCRIHPFMRGVFRIIR